MRQQAPLHPADLFDGLAAHFDELGGHLQDLASEIAAGQYEAAAARVEAMRKSVATSAGGFREQAQKLRARLPRVPFPRRR